MPDNQNVPDEIEIVCPVCGCFLVSAEGGLWVGRQFRFKCNSQKCRGKNRYINSKLLQKIIDEANNKGIVVNRKI